PNPLPSSPLNRRTFLATSAATAAAYALAARSLAAFNRDDPKGSTPAPTRTPAPTPPHAPPPNLTLSDGGGEGDDTNITPAKKKLKLLILGGTAFTGPHLVRLALARGHEVTVFNRGKTEQRIGSLPDSVKKLIGDRDPKKGDGLKALENTDTWDAVVDTSGYYPRHVKATGMLADRCTTYIFISSISAYKSPIAPGADESAPLATLADPSVEEMGRGYENYGGLKVLCENEVRSFMKGRCAIVRPTFISGPGDPTDRFTYWPVRVLRGGEVLCPGTPKDPIQFIDARDLAAFLLTLAENRTSGDFNAVGPNPVHPPYTLGELVRDSRDASKSSAAFTWVAPDFIEKNTPEGLAFGFPIWANPASDDAGMARVNFDAALRAGLTPRPPAETIRATLAWWPKEVARRERVGRELTEQARLKGEPEPKVPDARLLRAGPSAAAEKAVLDAWHVHTAADAPRPG
nr:NAD-dependent epimerase/dehydratase family protein [Phycisphaerales bacterium]